MDTLATAAGDDLGVDPLTTMSHGYPNRGPFGRAGTSPRMN